MAGRSSLKSLPPAILDAVHDAIGRGQTIDDICALLRDLGTERSRSAVGRYAKDFAELAKQQRRLQTISQAFGKEFGQSDDHQVRMMNQLMTSVMMRAIIPIASAEEDAVGDGDEEGGGAPDTLALSRLAKAVKDVTSSSKIDIEREAKIREEEARRTRERAVQDATQAGRSAGASEETLEAIRAGILGIRL
ncbi:phage protein Gp27 family protein [Sphingomonas sp.]|uniref:phage protein Gp27 family protein n=1 Tax=Sphingomonas sp. TaxID=28214 RepID=UPI0031E20696